MSIRVPDSMPPTPAERDERTSVDDAPQEPGASPARSTGDATLTAAPAPDVPPQAEGVVEVETAAPVVATRSDAAPPSTAYLFQPERDPVPVAVEDLARLVGSDDNFIWVDVCAYTAPDLLRIAEELRLTRRGVHTALSRWKRPRLDLAGDHFFVTATIPYLDSAAYRIQAHQLDLFVGRNYLVSAHQAPLPFGEGILARAHQNPAIVRDDSAYMLYILLDELLGYYEHVYEQMQGEIERMEERALSDTSDSFLEDLLRFKRYAFALSQLAEQHRPIFEAFLRADFPWVAGDDIEEYYSDLQDRLTRLSDALVSAKEAVNGAFDIYVSQMSHRTNNIMKVLTIVSTILLPASVILGFFGTSNLQNVPFLAQFPGFVLMVVSVVAVMVSVLVLLRRQGWL